MSNEYVVRPNNTNTSMSVDIQAGRPSIDLCRFEAATAREGDHSSRESVRRCDRRRDLKEPLTGSWRGATATMQAQQRGERQCLFFSAPNAVVLRIRRFAAIGRRGSGKSSRNAPRVTLRSESGTASSSVSPTRCARNAKSTVG